MDETAVDGVVAPDASLSACSSAGALVPMELGPLDDPPRSLAQTITLASSISFIGELQGWRNYFAAILLF